MFIPPSLFNITFFGLDLHKSQKLKSLSFSFWLLNFLIIIYPFKTMAWPWIHINFSIPSSLKLLRSSVNFSISQEPQLFMAVACLASFRRCSAIKTHTYVYCSFFRYCNSYRNSFKRCLLLPVTHQMFCISERPITILKCCHRFTIRCRRNF